MKAKRVNPFMTVAARVYGGGDYAHVVEKNFLSNKDVEGDTLFKFLMIELSTEEDCTDIETAIKRVDTAIADLQVVRDALSGQVS